MFVTTSLSIRALFSVAQKWIMQKPVWIMWPLLVLKFLGWTAVYCSTAASTSCVCFPSLSCFRAAGLGPLKRINGNAEQRRAQGPGLEKWTLPVSCLPHASCIACLTGGQLFAVSPKNPNLVQSCRWLYTVIYIWLLRSACCMLTGNANEKNRGNS